MLFRRMVVTMVGAPDVIVVAVVTSPVSAVKVPVGTKLKATWIGIAQAGEALTAATAITVLRRAVRRGGILIIISSLSPQRGRFLWTTEYLVLASCRANPSFLSEAPLYRAIFGPISNDQNLGT